MVKILRLLVLALATFAGGGALSAPVAEESTNGTSSDLEPDAHTPSIPGNVRGAKEIDLLAQAAREERGGKVHPLDEAANLVSPLVPKVLSSGLKDGDESITRMVKLVLKDKKARDIFSFKVLRARIMVARRKTFQKMAMKGVLPKHYRKALLSRVSRRNEEGILNADRQADAYEQFFSYAKRNPEKVATGAKKVD